MILIVAITPRLICGHNKNVWSVNYCNVTIRAILIFSGSDALKFCCVVKYHGVLLAPITWLQKQWSTFAAIVKVCYYAFDMAINRSGEELRCSRADGMPEPFRYAEGDRRGSSSLQSYLSPFVSAPG